MHTEPFRLDSGRLSKLAYAYAGYANATRDTKSQDVRINRASAFVIAASYFSLVDTAKAHECFLNASREYIQLGNPFAFALAVCSTKPERIEELGRINQLKEGASIKPSTEVFFYKRAYAFWQVSAKSDLYKTPDFETNEREQVGRLRLPLKVYNRVYSSAFNSFNDVELINSVSDLLNRVSEITQAAMQDQYHWQRLHSTILPVEPEILATMLSIMKRQKQNGVPSPNKSWHEMLDPIGWSYVSIASEMLG
jgi:hypothetical protein